MSHHAGVDVVKTGPNHKITRDARGVVRLRVWRNADLSYEEGADLAVEVRRCLEEQAAERSVRGLLVDLRDAPTVAGPRTREEIGAFFTAFVAHGHRVAVLVRDDAVMKMQLERLIADHCPREGRTFSSESLAVQFASTTADPD